MSDLRTAAQQALDVLETTISSHGDIARSAINDLRAALAQPDGPEPYAWMSVGGSIWRHKTTQDDVPLYTRPYRREWRELKEWEINDGLDQLPTEDVCNWSFRKGVYFAEKALKERNA